MPSRVLTPANEITILRLVFVPVFAILVIERHYDWALAVLVAAGVSDAVDGIVARISRDESPLGMALDPIADKILMTTAYLTLAFRDALPWWLTIIVISRDVMLLMTALLIILSAGYRPFPPSFLGKVSTLAQLVTIFVALSLPARVPFITGTLVEISIDLTAIFTVASGIHYLISGRSRVGRSSAEPGAATSADADRREPTESSAGALSSFEPRSRGGS